jgi:signal transduction histidine kinase
MALFQLGITYRQLGSLDKALDFFLQCLDLGEKYNHRMAALASINNIGSIYLDLERPDEALGYFQKCLEIRESQGDQRGAAECLCNIGRVYFSLQNFDKAQEYYLKANMISTTVSDKKGEANSLQHLAEIELALSNPEMAYEYASRCLSIRTGIGDQKGQAEVFLLLIDLATDRGKLSLMDKALTLATSTGSPDLSSKLHGKYYDYYKKHRILDKALEHLELYFAAEKEYHSQEFTQKTANKQMIHLVEQGQKESEIFRLRNTELAGLIEDSENQKTAMALAKDELNAIQRQMVQREKMASVGELTAGIAHEIQNPLNYVNNFSESGSELIEEMNIEMRKGNHAEVLKIAGELKNSLKKINFHGQRADAIVKSMLRFSPGSIGKKELTDINKLVDDYVRLTYHGMREKDKSFNAELDMKYDPSAGSLSIIPHDIGCVLLNVLNNAFYAVNEKRKTTIAEYLPFVSVSTSRKMDKIEIIVRDNGIGISDTIRDKIFQPFFTTKPTGEGTGLGLSISYDIIKDHGGEFTLETLTAGKDGRKGEGAKFIIVMPV